MKVCILCFRFCSQNVNRQPWRYVFELAKALSADGVDVKVISNGANSESLLVDGVNVRYVRTSDRTLQESHETGVVLREENPDAIIMLIGLLDLLKRKPSISKPTIAIMTSPLYDVNLVLRLGLGELLSHSKLIYVHLLGAILPRISLRRGAKFFDHIVVLSEANKTRLSGLGLRSEKITVVRPGIHSSDLILPNLSDVERVRAEISPDGSPIILYFGSPLSLRGTDTLLEAFAQVAFPSKLVILSRIDDQSTISENEMLKRMAEGYGLMDRVIINSSSLDLPELKKYICAANIVCLPFKLVISDVPITILEAMALGKPVVSTSLDGIPELLEGRGAVVHPSQHKELAKLIVHLITNSKSAAELGEHARTFMLTYPRWDEQSRKILAIIKQVSGHN